jgi:serine/threonine protein kinase
MFYEMLTGTVPFTGETPVDVMLKVVSQTVIPPRQKAPDIEITPEAEALIMKALSKDPMQRHQSMEELFNDLQQCYGSVRYRRQLEVRSPIQLQKVKRPSGTRPVESGPAGPTMPQTTFAAQPAPAPILLTKRKERKRTLPMDIGITADSPAPGPITGSMAAQDVPAGDDPTWLDAEGTDDEETGEWTDIDIDTPDGTRG